MEREGLAHAGLGEGLQTDTDVVDVVEVFRTVQGVRPAGRRVLGGERGQRGAVLLDALLAPGQFVLLPLEEDLQAPSDGFTARSRPGESVEGARRESSDSLSRAASTASGVHSSKAARRFGSCSLWNRIAR